MIANELNLNLIYFAVLTVLAMFVLVILVNWTNHREPLYALFIVRQIYFLAFTASFFGLHRYLFKNAPATTLDYLFSWIVVGATAAAFIFEWKFLREYSPKKWGRIALNSLLISLGVVIFLMASGKTYQALKTNMTLNAVGIVFFLLVSVFFIDQKKIDEDSDIPLLSKKLIVSYYFSLNLVLFISVLPLLGIIQGNDYASTGMVFYALCSSLIMTILMQLRIHKQRKIHADYVNKLLLSEHRIILEKNKREEQTHLFHMLMHEIKNPLAVIDMALLANNDQQTTTAYINRAINSVKDIIDRCFKAERLSDGNIDVKLTRFLFSDFLDNLFQSKNWDKNSFNLHVNESLTVTADLQLLGVILSNLFDNAVRYGDSQMPIDVEAQHGKSKAGIDGVTIVVSNRPGIASWPDPDKVFKKYYRSAGAEAQSGTGLGLYLVRTLANLMGGDCSYVPNDRSIRFELWLPI